MNKTINIAGIELDNDTVRESIVRLEQNIGANTFYKVQEVTMEMIMLAKNDERIRQALELMDQTIIAENEILDAVEKNTMQRQHEIAERAFFYEMMMRLERNHKSVFLLCEAQDKLSDFSSFIEDEFPNVNLVGMEVIEEGAGLDDAVVNEINVAHPDVVIGMLPSPMQQYFLLDNCDKLSTSLWYGVADELPRNKRKGLLSRLRKRMQVRTLEKHITNYEEQKESSK